MYFVHYAIYAENAPLAAYMAFWAILGRSACILWLKGQNGSQGQIEAFSTFRKKEGRLATVPRQEMYKPARVPEDVEEVVSGSRSGSLSVIKAGSCVLLRVFADSGLQDARQDGSTAAREGDVLARRPPCGAVALL